MSRGTGYGDRRRDRSEGTVRVGSVWPIGKAGFYPGPSAARGSRKNHFTKNSVTPADDLLLDAAMRCDLDEACVCPELEAGDLLLLHMPIIHRTSRCP